MKSILQAFAGLELRLGCSGSTSIQISCFPLNLAYQKRCLSFLPAFRRVFWNSSQSRSLHGKEEINCPVSLSLPCVFWSARPGFGYHPQWEPTLLKSHSFPSSRGRNAGFVCFEDHNQTNLISHSRGCQGFIPVPVKFASVTTGFHQFGAFHLSPRGT